MLSILIPIYNFDCRRLVKDLVAQAMKLEEAVEIICLDDCSTEAFATLNQEISLYASFVQYDYLHQNIGRAKIRNVLAQKAIFPYLLFMDCDSAVREDNFLKKYIANCRANTVVCGGRSYLETPPKNAFRLHWEVGRKREQLSAAKRNEMPYHQFMTNNFLAPKTIFDRLQFNEEITQYGHEDTLFGLALKQLNINILHIDNSLLHIGLETTATFLMKTEQAVENLAMLVQKGKPIETTLLRAFWQLKRWRLLALFHWLFQRFAIAIRRKLYCVPPSLRAYDLYKLGKFVEKYINLTNMK